MTVFIVNHPLGEPKYWKNDVKGDDKGRIVIEWNQDDRHHRKFFEWAGAMVSSTGDITKEMGLLFWGEYEPRTKCRLLKGSHAKAVHDVLVPVGGNNIPVPSAKGKCGGNCGSLHYDTDPYVFGDEFYYVGCKRKANGTYAPGDIILFGGLRRSDKGRYNMLELDTVIVVKEKRPVSSFNPTSNFYKATLDPCHRSGEVVKDVIVGKGFTDFDTPFSFVPCHRKQSLNVADYGIKPTIDLEDIGFTGLARPRGTFHPVCDCSYKAWQKILDAVKDFDLAVEFDEIK